MTLRDLTTFNRSVTINNDPLPTEELHDLSVVLGRQVLVPIPFYLWQPFFKVHLSSDDDHNIHIYYPLFSVSRTINNIVTV